jgi:hypothetical protein
MCLNMKFLRLDMYYKTMIEGKVLLLSSKNY